MHVPCFEAHSIAQIMYCGPMHCARITSTLQHVRSVFITPANHVAWDRSIVPSKLSAFVLSRVGLPPSSLTRIAMHCTCIALHCTHCIAYIPLHCRHYLHCITCIAWIALHCVALHCTGLHCMHCIACVASIARIALYA